MNEKTQREAILKYLKSGNALSALPALDMFNCLRLAARIHDLRRKGHNIETEMRSVHKGKRIAIYRLVSK